MFRCRQTKSKPVSFLPSMAYRHWIVCVLLKTTLNSRMRRQVPYVKFCRQKNQGECGNQVNGHSMGSFLPYSLGCSDRMFCGYMATCLIQPHCQCCSTPHPTYLHVFSVAIGDDCACDLSCASDRRWYCYQLYGGALALGGKSAQKNTLVPPLPNPPNPNIRTRALWPLD